MAAAEGIAQAARAGGHARWRHWLPWRVNTPALAAMMTRVLVQGPGADFAAASAKARADVDADEGLEVGLVDAGRAHVGAARAANKAAGAEGAA